MLCRAGPVFHEFIISSYLESKRIFCKIALDILIMPRVWSALIPNPQPPVPKEK
jgi:hypothetical protein